MWPTRCGPRSVPLAHLGGHSRRHGVSARVFGAFNGFFVAKFKLHPFIVTLGTQLIVYTLLLLYVQMGNNNGMAISNLDKSYTDFCKGRLFKAWAAPRCPGMCCSP